MSKAKAKEVVYPIQHWSMSSMLDFLDNPLMFKKKWILRIFGDESGVSATIGKAGHKALETIFGGNELMPVSNDLDEAIPVGIQTGLEYLDKIQDHYIDYKKTGTREKMLATYAKVIQWYTEEMPRDWDVVSSEETFQEHLLLPGEKKKAFAIPMKCKTDLIVRKANGRLRIIDHKFTSKYTDPDQESAIKVIQSMFIYHSVKRKYGEEPEDIIYRECKTSQNKDGTSQTKEWGITFADVPHYFTTFYRLYDDCTKLLIRPDPIFLPNVRAMYDGDESFLIYQQNLLGIDMSDVEIDHTTHHVRYMAKESTFSSSMLDTADADSMMPEERVRMKLGEFGIPVKAGPTHQGASVTLYTFTPSRGVSVKRVEKHVQDIALALRAQSVRILAPIPGTNMIGIEVPRADRDVVRLTDDLMTKGSFEIPIGVDLYGTTIKKDLRDMPHLLVAGATGAGKSVCINGIIYTLTNQVDNLEMVLIDPKQVELAHWGNNPKLRGEIITSVSETVKTLNGLVGEMEKRYTTLREAGVKSIDQYSGMNYLLVVIDEFADLIMSREKQDFTDAISGETMHKVVSGGEIESSVIRLAQKGRAAGIHLVIGTQRPSVNVITGLIKANCPCRIAFMTSSIVDSKVILDTKGAEELLGKGDMLFADPAHKGLQRLQGFYFE